MSLPDSSLRRPITVVVLVIAVLLGAALASQGRFDQAVQEFREAVRLDPPAAGSEIGQRRQLPSEATAVATVAPLGDGDEPLTGRHGRKMAWPGARVGIVSARAAPFLLALRMLSHVVLASLARHRQIGSDPCLRLPP